MFNNKLIIITFAVVLVASVKGDNFPSLITSNATLAIVIDRDYLSDDFEKIKTSIETYLVYVKRELLKHGGVNVQYFTWANINIKKDITAILSIASCVDTWHIFQIAQEQKLLHMAISEANCPRLPSNEAITISLVRNGEETSQIVLDLRAVNAYKWNSATIIFDHTLNRDSITKVSNSFTNDFGKRSTTAASVALIKINTNSSSTQNRANILNSLHNINVKTMGRNFLAIVSSDNMEILMEIAKIKGLVTVKNQWLYIISDVHINTTDVTNVKRLLNEGDNVSFLYNTTIDGESCKIGLDCYVGELLEAFSRALDAAISEELDLSSLVSDEEWEAIRPSKTERRDSLLNSIKGQISSSGTCGNCTKWNIQAGDTWGREYIENKTSSSELIEVGTWRPSDGCTLTDVLFPHIVHGFRGRILPMHSFHNPPWQILNVNDTGYILEMTGLVFDIIHEISNSLNFTYKITISNNSAINYNKTFYIPKPLTSDIPDSIISMIRRKEIAMTAAVYTVTPKGKEIINFTMPIETQIYTFLVARPKELSRALLFMSPFKGYSWLCISTVLVSMGPILYFIDRLSPVYKYKGVNVKGGLSSIENCIWYMYGALLQQGGMHLPGADSSRIIVGSWWLVVLVITTTYCGNLVAFLTFPKIDIPLRTIEDILEHKETISWSIAKNSYFDKQLKVTTEPKYKALRNGMIPDTEDRTNMLFNIENGKHVFIDWKLNLQVLMKRQFTTKSRCDLALGSEEFFEEQLSFLMAQDSPYLELINDEIKRLHQMGLIYKWLNSYLPKRDKCFKMKYNEVNNHTVNLDDMQGSFFVLFIGFTISLLIITIERLFSNYKRKHQKNIITYTS